MYHPPYTFVMAGPSNTTHHPMYDITAEPRSRNGPAAAAILSVYIFVPYCQDALDQRSIFWRTALSIG